MKIADLYNVTANALERGTAGRSAVLRRLPRFRSLSDELDLTLLDHIAYMSACRSRSALVTTDTELKAIAAPAKIGDTMMPKNGYTTHRHRYAERVVLLTTL